ncbi:MAG: Co2+/Mg2+ efflux protein ApaG [Halioglobus sp.]|nr:Co2+/Mg2+ efflux protein ApaG [Halioglobus sp.]
MNKVPFDPSQVTVQVITAYLAEHSQPEAGQYNFAYTITVANHSHLPVQLLSRHWLITDADNDVQEVHGEGVVGEQPVIAAGESFRYTSGATLATPVGYMEGEYFMVVRDPIDIDPGDLPIFEVPIPPFSLHTPTALN